MDKLLDNCHNICVQLLGYQQYLGKGYKKVNRLTGICGLPLKSVDNVDKFVHNCGFCGKAREIEEY